MRDLQHREGGDARSEAREPHQRHADQQREHAADGSCEQKRGDVPDRVVAEDREQLGQHARLGLEWDRDHAREERANGDEAQLTERQHPRVADEDVDRDDDRHRHEGREEVDLRGTRHERAAHADGDHERGRAEELREGLQMPSHTRSIVDERPRTKRPAGRSRRTRMTSANTTEGRKTVLIGRQGTADQPGGEADCEPAERRRPQPVDAADNDADEHDDRLLEREVRSDRTGSARSGSPRRWQRGRPTGSRRSRSRRSRARRAGGRCGNLPTRRASAARSACARGGGAESAEGDHCDEHGDDRHLAHVHAPDGDRPVERGDRRPRPRRSCRRARRSPARRSAG